MDIFVGGTLSRRTDTRITASIPVRIWGIDANGKPFNEELQTTDISLVGARIANIKAQLRQGDIVGMQSAAGKARFRVTWAGEADRPSAGHISLCCVEPGKCIWDAALFDTPEPPSLLEPIGSRRKSVRHLCPGGAEVLSRTGGLALWCRLADISYTGCYLETPSPLPPGTHVQLTLTTGGVKIRCEAQVRTSHTTVGMGLGFLDMGDVDADSLGKLINKLAGTDDEDSSQMKQRLSGWIENLEHCHDSLKSLRQMVEQGEVHPEPKMAGDMERLTRAIFELRETVLSRVTNYGQGKVSD